MSSPGSRLPFPLPSSVAIVCITMPDPVPPKVTPLPVITLSGPSSRPFALASSSKSSPKSNSPFPLTSSPGSSTPSPLPVFRKPSPFRSSLRIAPT